MDLPITYGKSCSRNRCQTEFERLRDHPLRPHQGDNTSEMIAYRILNAGNSVSDQAQDIQSRS
jgi:hypothetical protein